MPDRRWLAGVRRYHYNERGSAPVLATGGEITGAVWSPDRFVVSEHSVAIANLAEAGARPDARLLDDVVLSIVRPAADALLSLYKDSDGTDGYVAVWLDADVLADNKRAARRAWDLVDDIDRDNVAVAFAWSPQRAPLLTAVVAAGVPVALGGEIGVESLTSIAKARQQGMEQLRAHDEEADETYVFLLGSAESAEGVFGVSLVTEIGLYAPGDVAPVTLPSSPDAERAAWDKVRDGVKAAAKAGGRDPSAAPSGFDDRIERRCRGLDGADAGLRIWRRDHTLWRPDPSEIADRLGWLALPESMAAVLDDLMSFARQARSGGLSRVVLLGMGGSSLAPETFRATLGGGVALDVLDTTDPDHVAGVAESLQPDSTLFVVSSKSGTTVETLSHLEYLWDRVGLGDRFVAITDPGTPLADLAGERGFLRTFLNPPEIGGRYSALSYFGLVPAALCGLDVSGMLARARTMMYACGPSVPAADNPGLRLAAALGEGVADGRDKLTLLLPVPLAALGDWLEQLIAESLGKQGKGIVPVTGETAAAPDNYGDDRLFVAYALAEGSFAPELDAIEADHPVLRIRVPDPQALPAEMYRWELATAALGYLLDVNPFDQPDVESAKQRAREALDATRTPVERGSATALLDDLKAPRYLAIQAFLAPSRGNAERLQAVRMKLRDRLGVATTVGFGPRFLHSTGQLHKGGPDSGRFLQITGEHVRDVPIPGKPYTFGRLIDAQADGDLAALRDAGRSVARLTLPELEALA